MSATIQPQPAGAQPAPTPAAPTVPIATRVGQYVAVRDKIKEIKDRHKAELEPYNQALEALGGVLLAHLNATGTNSSSSEQGTFYKNRKPSVSIADGSVFRDWVLESGAYNMVDWRANVNAVEAYLETHQELPPGLNHSVVYVAGVRRPSSNSAE